MNEALLITALITGLLGSAHCIGMCGPIALALPTPQGASRYPALILYNLGRSLTYALLGVIPGLLGLSLSILGLSRWISIGLGVLMLIALAIGYGKKMENHMGSWKLLKSVQKTIAQLFKKQGNLNLFVIGLLNGLLPCGLVYTALLLAIATGSVLSSATFMFVFGMGTLPAMFLISVFGQFIKTPLRVRINRLMPYMLGLVATLLIVRGLNLGIPYISPSVNTQGEVECCKPKQSESATTDCKSTP